MNPLVHLAEQRPLIFVHLLAALAALAIGAVVLARRKGTPSHRALGWSWVAAMGTAVITSVFIRSTGFSGPFGFSPIHLLTAFVAVLLPRAVWLARQGRIDEHRKAMRSLYLGGCIVAGLFTLLPMRFLGRWLWTAMGLV